MERKTQREYVINLLKRGYITRNECLDVYISRLGAIMDLLRKEGYNFFGRYTDKIYGRDYIYVMRRGNMSDEILFRKAISKI